jgi:hypothetical protein
MAEPSIPGPRPVILRLKLLLQNCKVITHQVVIKFWQSRFNQDEKHGLRSINSLILLGIEKNFLISKRVYCFTNLQEERKTSCSNWHGISLLSTSYKILSNSFSQGFDVTGLQLIIVSWPRGGVTYEVGGFGPDTGFDTHHLITINIGALDNSHTYMSAVYYTCTEYSWYSVLRQFSGPDFQQLTIPFLFSQTSPSHSDRWLTVRCPSWTASTCPDLYCLALSQQLILLELCPIINFCSSSSYFATNGQSASPSWCQVPLWDPWPHFHYCQTFGLHIVGHHPWREVGSVIYSYTLLSLPCSSPAELMTTSYYLIWD